MQVFGGEDGGGFGGERRAAGERAGLRAEAGVVLI